MKGKLNFDFYLFNEGKKINDIFTLDSLHGK